MNLFIDANIFLSFYDFTSEGIAELRKLVLLIEEEKVDLLLPQQVADEVKRRRAAIISRSLKEFSQSKISLTFPSYCKEYKNYDAMQHHLGKLEELHRTTTEDIQQDIDNQKLPADLLLKDLFSRATRIDNTPELIECARQRVELGNPPGKKGSIGDAVIWESLLGKTTNEDDIYIVSDDADFGSPLDGGKLNEFLWQEWVSRKQSELYFHRKLSEFFKEEFPEIHLKTEI
ncbi:MAG: hypothetical protein F4X32_01915 [Candidatus Dadabacteria bacterium]|nr:hypothetical protein [Candidatus Dadabacteria bacterium]